LPSPRVVGVGLREKLAAPNRRLGAVVRARASAKPRRAGRGVAIRAQGQLRARTGTRVLKAKVILGRDSGGPKCDEDNYSHARRSLQKASRTIRHFARLRSRLRRPRDLQANDYRVRVKRINAFYFGALVEGGSAIGAVLESERKRERPRDACKLNLPPSPRTRTRRGSSRRRGASRHFRRCTRRPQN
jgi:hypothetical protein